MSRDNIINNFLKAIEESYAGLNLKTSWPLEGAQIDAYFDIDEALDMFYRIKELQKTKTIEEIATMMPPPDIMRIFLQHNAIIGLKVARKLKLTNISQEEIIDYTLVLFDILKHKVKNDIFCLDGKNILLSQNEMKNIPKYKEVNSREEQRTISSLIVNANAYCYSLFYDTYMTGGFYMHGPYELYDDVILIVREYHNLAPHELWNNCHFPYKKIRLYTIYKHLHAKINFVNHIITHDTIGDKLIQYHLEVDDKEYPLHKAHELIQWLQTKTKEQTAHINALSPLDQVRKGAEIAYYLFKKVREAMGDAWKPEGVEKTIELFQEKFIKQFAYERTPSMEYWKEIYDPRIDYQVNNA